MSPQPDALDRALDYDALYRLISATGREHVSSGPRFPWDDRPGSQDVTQAQRYTETYQYDLAGNLVQLHYTAHNPGNTGGFTRRLELAADSNRLRGLTTGNGITTPRIDYTHDDNGNLRAEGSSRHFEWDHSDQIKAFRNQAAPAEPSVYAHYLYDAGGMRVKKLVRKQGGGFSATVYIDELFEHHRWGRATGAGLQVDGQNTHLHVVDDQQRIALIRVGSAHPDDRGPAVQYHLSDHLASSNVVIGGSDATGSTFVNREEQTPYGETAFGSFGRKRYRFGGKERDEESGLYYFGLRYYAPWLARWTSCDPLCVFAEVFAEAGGDQNPFAAFGANPLRFVDPLGLQPEQSNLNPAEEFQGRLNAALQQGWVIETDQQGKPIEFEAPEWVGKTVRFGEKTFEYKSSTLLTHPHMTDPQTGEPAQVQYNGFVEVEPGNIEKVLGAITPILEWASCIPVVGDFVDLGMPAVYAAQGRHEEAALAAIAAATPGLSIGMIKKTGLGDKAMELLGRSADAGATVGKAGTKSADVKSVAKPVVEPDVYVEERIPIGRKKVAPKVGSYRGVTPKDRREARRIGKRWGPPGVDYHVGHRTPLSQTAPGDPVRFRAERAPKNLQDAPTIVKQNKSRRKAGFYVRP